MSLPKRAPRFPSPFPPASLHIRRESVWGRNLELALGVVEGVQENVEGAAAGGDVGAPPPVVVFGAELEVGEDEGDLAAGEEEDDEHQQQEAEEVVELVQPDGGEHVEHLCAGGW